MSRTIVEMDSSGVVVVSRADTPTGDTSAVEPIETESLVNAYGASIERIDYGEGLVVERSYDDDTRLREVSVSGPWGRQTMAVRADDRRTLRWEAAPLVGTESWDDGGPRTPQTVSYAGDDRSARGPSASGDLDEPLPHGSPASGSSSTAE